MAIAVRPGRAIDAGSIPRAWRGRATKALGAAIRPVPAGRMKRSSATAVASGARSCITAEKRISASEPIAMSP